MLGQHETLRFCRTAVEVSAPCLHNIFPQLVFWWWRWWTSNTMLRNLNTIPFPVSPDSSIYDLLYQSKKQNELFRRGDSRFHKDLRQPKIGFVKWSFLRRLHVNLVGWFIYGEYPVSGCVHHVWFPWVNRGFLRWDLKIAGGSAWSVYIHPQQQTSSAILTDRPIRAFLFLEKRFNILGNMFIHIVAELRWEE